ncbi:hypothetical protein AB1Y20_017105 [Prymnesium parvum]|uniref:Uncharacterized protein n=1 Tax=Prymnesium parvum TaxID=97485 RepID=A0AB34ICD7_PRYPA
MAADASHAAVAAQLHQQLQLLKRAREPGGKGAAAAALAAIVELLHRPALHGAAELRFSSDRGEARVVRLGAVLRGVVQFVWLDGKPPARAHVEKLSGVVRRCAASEAVAADAGEELLRRVAFWLDRASPRLLGELLDLLIGWISGEDEGDGANQQSAPPPLSGQALRPYAQILHHLVLHWKRDMEVEEEFGGEMIDGPLGRLLNFFKHVAKHELPAHIILSLWRTLVHCLLVHGINQLEDVAHFGLDRLPGGLHPLPPPRLRRQFDRSSRAVQRGAGALVALRAAQERSLQARRRATPGAAPLPPPSPAFPSLSFCLAVSQRVDADPAVWHARSLLQLIVEAELLLPADASPDAADASPRGPAAAKRQRMSAAVALRAQLPDLLRAAAPDDQPRYLLLLGALCERAPLSLPAAAILPLAELLLSLLPSDASACGWESLALLPWCLAGLAAAAAPRPALAGGGVWEAAYFKLLALLSRHAALPFLPPRAAFVEHAARAAAALLSTRRLRPAALRRALRSFHTCALFAAREHTQSFDGAEAETDAPRRRLLAWLLQLLYAQPAEHTWPAASPRGCLLHSQAAAAADEPLRLLCRVVSRPAADAAAAPRRDGATEAPRLDGSSLPADYEEAPSVAGLPDEMLRLELAAEQIDQLVPLRRRPALPFDSDCPRPRVVSMPLLLAASSRLAASHASLAESPPAPPRLAAAAALTLATWQAALLSLRGAPAAPASATDALCNSLRLAAKLARPVLAAAWGVAEAAALRGALAALAALCDDAAAEWAAPLRAGPDAWRMQLLAPLEPLLKRTLGAPRRLQRTVPPPPHDE